MTLILEIFRPYFDWGIEVPWVAAQLGASVTLGAAAYINCLFLLWWIEGRPQGLETLALGMLAKLRQRISCSTGIVTPSA
jgi:hypothetical protein